jgi:hypothetical protein
MTSRQGRQWRATVLRRGLCGTSSIREKIEIEYRNAPGRFFHLDNLARLQRISRASETRKRGGVKPKGVDP